MLKQEISRHFAVDARRTDLLTRLLVALLQVCTVSYAQLALALNAKVKISSNVKRHSELLAARGVRTDEPNEFGGQPGCGSADVANQPAGGHWQKLSDYRQVAGERVAAVQLPARTTRHPRSPLGISLRFSAGG